MSNPWTEQEEQLLAEYLVQRVADEVTGRATQECVVNYPRDTYFVGNLRPKDDALPAPTDPGYLRELRSKLAPVAFGAEFVVSTAGQVTIAAEVRWACYYRVFPTLDQQRSHQQYLTQTNASGAADTSHNADANPAGNDGSADAMETLSAEVEAPASSSPDEPLLAETDGPLVEESDEPTESDTTASTAEADQDDTESSEAAESPSDRRRQRSPRDSLFIRFRKISCHATGAIVLAQDSSGAWMVDPSNLDASLKAETLRAQQLALSDGDHLRNRGSSEQRVTVPEAALNSPADYANFLADLTSDVIPAWDWELRCQVRPIDPSAPNEQVIAIELVNNSPRQMPAGDDGENPNIEAFFFEPEIVCQFTGGAIRPFELELAPKNFRYDRNLWGRGFNCAVERVNVTPPVLRTTCVPVYKQRRYVTQARPLARFADLATAPVPILAAVYDAMQKYRSEWQLARAQYTAADSNWVTRHQQDFDADLQQFEDEIRRFRRGCQLISRDPDVRLAFELTNQTFQQVGAHPAPSKRKEAWRLFQLVFLVTQIPGIAALRDAQSPDVQDRENVDIVYFPTGGGKTEAYLAGTVFHCFFDRLRGKTAGVTAWTRFPLRLLTLQQTQRVADVIGAAELLRRSHADPRLSGSAIDGFAVGYFVGEGGSPNEIADPAQLRHPDAKLQVTWSKVNDVQARQEWRRVVTCPSCRTPSITLDFDPASVRLQHRCQNANCRFPKGILPVYVVDNEVYRYLPTVLVGTIDKLAGIGNQRKMAQIFGQVDGRCAVHGYYKKKCCQKDCTDVQRLRPGKPVGLDGPTLFVQDELHLLREGLGTFDAHYETFVQRLQRAFGQGATLKVIASSATIEAFERQVQHLYGRRPAQARVFPGRGPTAESSFYAETMSYPQRLFVGMIPHNKTIFNALLELLESYHRVLQGLQMTPASAANPYGGTVAPGTANWKLLLDYYETSVSYFLAGRELSSIRTDIEHHTNPRLQASGLRPLEVHELTGDTPTNEVTRTLERVEQTSSTGQMPVSVLATSMISHGVDVDRFNSMFFYGMPRQNAEYIQASSRVGRSHVGIVFDCFHPARERDQSHYSYFVKYHEFLGQLVEPVAINRWAKFSVSRTLPGLFMAVLLQVIANSSNSPGRYYMLDYVRQQISSGLLRESDFIPLLEEAYMVSSPVTPAETTFQGEITLRVRQFLDQILGASPTQRYVSEALIPRAIRSLRDVDEPIEIELDSTGSQWANRPSRRP